MTKTDFVKTMDTLSLNRPVFHSEDDFKFALSWLIKEQHPEYNIFLERPIAINMIDRSLNEKTVRAPIDIILKSLTNTVLIELKYKTNKAEFTYQDEYFYLKNHSAIDEGRFRFRKDIYRIDKYVQQSSGKTKGFVVQLTNNLNYMTKDESTTRNYDKNYSMHKGHTITKQDLGWNYEKHLEHLKKDPNGYWYLSSNEKMHWTCKGDNHFKLELSEDYPLSWYRYSNIEDNKFYYCLVEVKGRN